jgi:three-Cys-motif partner protein
MSQIPLFSELPEHRVQQLQFGEIKYPVWTENKARLVAEYLRLFVFITKHGCYIDGFAGPKNTEKPESWAARLVLASEPKLLREFFLCDTDPAKVELLEDLKAEHPIPSNRQVNVLAGDFNNLVGEILQSGVVTPKKATFCLLDQFSTECHWNTLEQLAAHKTDTAKIELFYFLATGWLDRAIAGFTRNTDIPRAWWGRDDYVSLLRMKGDARAQLFCERFRQELGYTYAVAWPIMDRGSRGRVMFHMIHATDHNAAPKLMERAYRMATRAPVREDQLELSFASEIAAAYVTP